MRDDKTFTISCQQTFAIERKKLDQATIFLRRGLVQGEERKKAHPEGW